MAVARNAGINHFFGGTLFEHELWAGRLGEFTDFLHHHGTEYLEVSNGTIPLDQHEKATHITRSPGSSTSSPRSGSRTRGAPRR